MSKANIQKKNSKQILRPISVKSLKSTSNKKNPETQNAKPTDEKYCKTDFFSNTDSKMPLHPAKPVKTLESEMLTASTVKNYMSRSLDSKSFSELFEEKEKHKRSQIEELNSFLMEVKAKKNENGESFISFPRNFDEFVDQASESMKFQKDNEFLINSEEDSQILYDEVNKFLRNGADLEKDKLKEKLKRIEFLEKVLKEKEDKLNDFRRKKTGNDPPSADSSKLFLTDFKRNKVLMRNNEYLKANEEDGKEEEEEDIAKPYLYQSKLDKLSVEQLKRLENLEKTGIDSEENPFWIETKELDEKIFEYKKQYSFLENEKELKKEEKKKFGDPILREQQEKRLLMTRMTEINEKLFKISTDEKNLSLEQRKKIEDLIFELQNNNFTCESTEIVHHPKKIDILFQDLAETENRAKKVLETLDLEELKQDVKESKILLNESLTNFKKFTNNLKGQVEIENEMREMEYNNRKREYLKEVLEKLEEKYDDVYELNKMATEFETKLNDQINLMLEEYKKNNENNAEHQLQDQNIIKPMEIEEYDRIITERVRLENPNLFVNI